MLDEHTHRSGATTIGIMTVTLMPHSLMLQIIIILNLMPHYIKTLSTMTFSIMSLNSVTFSIKPLKTQ